MIALITQASKVMLKILQARLQLYVNHELPDVQAGFRKGRGPDIKLPTSVGSSNKAREFQGKKNLLKSRDITLSTKVHLVKDMAFAAVLYGCERCTIKKAERQRMMLLNCGV